MLIVNHTSTITNTNYSRDLTTDSTTYNITDDLTDFAVRLDYEGSNFYPDIQANLD
jgi:hypothetical protein